MYVVQDTRLDNAPAAHAGLASGPLRAVRDAAALPDNGRVHLRRGLLELLGLELAEVPLAVSLLAAVLVAPGGLAPGGLLASTDTLHLGSCVGVSGDRGGQHVPMALAQPLAAPLRQLPAHAVGFGRVDVGALLADGLDVLLGVAIGIDLRVVALAVSLEVAGRLFLAVFDRAEELGPVGLIDADPVVVGVELRDVLLEMDLAPTLASALCDLLAALHKASLPGSLHANALGRGWVDMVRLWLESGSLGLDLLPVDATEAALGRGREMGGGENVTRDVEN